MDGDEISCRIDNPFRRPEWRWNRAVYLAEGGRPAGPDIDDDWVTRVTTYLAVANGAQQPDPKWQQPNDTVVATAAWCWEKNSETRWRLEAMVLADHPVAMIADQCGQSTDMVDAYEAIFFDVRRCLAARDWVVCQVLGGMLPWNTRREAPGSLWRIAGFFGGVPILDVMIAVTLNRPLSPVLQGPLPVGFADANDHEEYTRKSCNSLISMLTAETNDDWAQVGQEMKAFAQRYPCVAGGIDGLARFKSQCDSLTLLRTKPSRPAGKKTRSLERGQKAAKQDRKAKRQTPDGGGSPSADDARRPPKG
jgi:hypothetical protein